MTIQATVTDSIGIASQRAALSLEIDPPGGMPRITTSCPLNTTTAGLPVAAAAIASAAIRRTTGPPPDYRPGCGWTPREPSREQRLQGPRRSRCSLPDSRGQAASVGCGITVNPAPSIGTTSLAPGTVGAPYAQSLTAFGGTGTRIWSSDSLPSWLTVEPLTGLLSGTPDNPGSYTFSLRVTDSLGAASAPRVIHHHNYQHRGNSDRHGVSAAHWLGRHAPSRSA
ncbi:MAG: Ig domain-containing protein [Ignavibacteriota bacterium]